MRQVKWVALLALLCLVPQPAEAQRGIKERRIARLMDQLRDELWSYRRELNFFRRAREYNRLVDLRYQLRGLAIRVAELEGRGPRAQRTQRDLARRMETRARALKRLTGRLERRTDLGAPREVRRRADSLKRRADRIQEVIRRLHTLIR